MRCGNDGKDSELYSLLVYKVQYVNNSEYQAQSTSLK